MEKGQESVSGGGREEGYSSAYNFLSVMLYSQNRNSAGDWRLGKRLLLFSPHLSLLCCC